ncbi:ABC transporter substrate-binding protein [Methylobacterium sp. 4-46]|uniref:ABC transporter substrate-binding protein n=1 Tax=unclassified Methylobacterium TaxID=2615210 RepID=UPI000152D91A|nr:MULTISPECIES: ABC transporter substrate-binding protein [Methylobacterium]ACA20516.1 ABC transporter substrate-binding protein [Methylobacterium sp. 4-46]WFT79682.1 ABC transporter substrate-binding protein [Methylobacterium nodulans]
MPARQRRTTGRALLAPLAALALAGAARAEEPVLTDGKVKLAVLTDMSSVYADSTGRGSLIAAEMAVRDFGGTIGGRPIEVVSADHQNKPDVGSNIARQWYDRDGVDVILDVPTSSVALAVQQIAREKGRILIVSGGGTSDLTGPACSPTGLHWTYDTYALSHVSGQAAVKRGLDTWAFVTADYAFGHALERDGAAEVKRSGGKVLSTVRAPFATADFSSFLIQAQGSGAKLVAFANAGGDTVNAIKQAHEFGIVQGGQTLLALLINIDDVHSLGIDVAQGLLLTTAFYWDRDEATRAFATRFKQAYGLMPTMHQAGVYSAVTHYLKAVREAGTDDALKVVAKMREMPVDDMFARGGRVREDGRMVHDMYLMQVKTPQESKGEWDLYKLLATVPGDEAFRPLAEGGCPLVKAAR